MKKVNLSEKFSLIKTHWDPKIVGELNGQFIKLVKFKGAFIWHAHQHEDEMFLVIKGSFEMHFRDRTIGLEEGDFIIVPKQIEHRPEALNEVHVLLFEPKTTINTGEISNDKTVLKCQHI